MGTARIRWHLVVLWALAGALVSLGFTRSELGASLLLSFVGVTMIAWLAWTGGWSRESWAALLGIAVWLAPLVWPDPPCPTDTCLVLHERVGAPGIR